MIVLLPYLALVPAGHRVEVRYYSRARGVFKKRQEVVVEAPLLMDLDSGVTFTYNASSYSYIGANPSVWVEAPQISVNGPANFSGFSGAYFHATVGNLSTTGDVLSANLEAAGSIIGGAGEISGGSFLVAGNDITSGGHLGSGQISAGGNRPSMTS